MILRICAVKDTAVQEFGTPQFVMANGQAVRSFKDEVNRRADDNALSKHPDDYEMYSVGEFDTASGLFVTHPPELLIRGKDCLLASN